MREDSGYFSGWDVDTPTNSVFIDIDKKSNEREEIYSEDETSDSESEIYIPLSQLRNEQQCLESQNEEDFSDNGNEVWEDAQEETEEPQEIFYDALEKQNNQESQQIRPEEVIINIQPEENNENSKPQPSYLSQAINKGKKLVSTPLNYALKTAKWAGRNPKTATTFFLLGTYYLVNQYQQNPVNQPALPETKGLNSDICLPNFSNPFINQCGANDWPPEQNYPTPQPEKANPKNILTTLETVNDEPQEPLIINNPPINPKQPGNDLKKISKVWRNLTLQWHPDKNNDAQAEEIFKIIANYYEEYKLRIEKYPQFKLNNALVERLASLLNSNSTEILEKLRKIGLTNDQNQQPHSEPKKKPQYRGRNTNYEEWKHPTKSQGEERGGLTPNDYHYEGNSEKSQQAAFFQYLKLFATFLMIDKVLFSDELEITEKQLIAISHIEQYWELKANSEGKINEKSCEEILGADWKEQIKSQTTGKEIAKIIEELKTLIDQAKVAEAATQQESSNHEAEEDNQRQEQTEQERQRQEQTESERREQERQEQEAERLARERTERERSRQNEYTPNSNFSASSESTNSYSSHTTEEKTTNQTENTSQSSSSFTAETTTATFSAPGGGDYSGGGTVIAENFMAPKSPVEIIKNILNQAQKAIESQQIPPLETAEKKITALFEEKDPAKKQVYYEYQTQLEEKLTQVIQTKTIQEIQLNHLDIARQIEENIEPQKIQGQEWKEVIENTPIEKIPELKKEIQNDILWQTRRAVINNLNSLLGSELKVYDLDSSFSHFAKEVHQKPLTELATYQQQVAAHIAEKKTLKKANLNNTSFTTQQKTSEWKTVLPVTLGVAGTAVGIGALYYWLNGKTSQISKTQIVSPPQQIKALINQFFTNLKKLQNLGYSAELSQTIQENLQQIQSLTEQWIAMHKNQFNEKQWNSFQKKYRRYSENKN
ncbi:J domain-containing protein [endosymbiont GvMRE of Glomus versiforme]|uniref:J domain-containing protein n=1 Tax=endosymbiont GvMRE of Glomus versiforme TaxID=2039283 RepID=UPI0011C39F94|nr:J domain-containing protein [endosymbiont GvMRE of Glomus versiforme]